MSQVMLLMEKQGPLQPQEAQLPQELCSFASRLVAFSIPPVLNFFYRESWPTTSFDCLPARTSVSFQLPGVSIEGNITGGYPNGRVF
jgi:hypothetical protein